MEIRYIKIALVIFASLQALIHATQNIVNIKMAYQSVAYVMGGTDHTVYTSSMFPTITTPALIWMALIVILFFEYATGLVAAKGALDLWSKRKGSADDFNSAKKFALVGCGLGMITWFGLFGVIGGGAFQMWQTQIGDSSFDGAFQFMMSYAFIYFLVSQADT